MSNKCTILLVACTRVLNSCILTTFYYSQSPILNQSAILQTLCYSLKQLSCNESSAILNTIATNHNLQVSIYAMSALEKINVGVN